jgi:hypothetical protein
MPAGWGGWLLFSLLRAGELALVGQFFLLSTGSLEQLWVDGEVNSHAPTKHFAGGGANRFCKRVLQPVLKEMVWHPHREELAFPGELGVGCKPKVVAWLSDAPGDGLPQRGHDVAITGRQGIPLASSCSAKVGPVWLQERRVHSQEGNACPGQSHSEIHDCRRRPPDLPT